jgi:hypothetical protein
LPSHSPLRVEIFVAPTGAATADDEGPGTADRPLATLEEAQRRARDHVAPARTDITVVLLDGIHRLSSPLRFGAADSVRDGHTVTWAAAPGASPVVSGAKPVTDWELDDAEAGVYKADVGTGFDSRQLYVDGVLATRARMRLPNSDITLTPTGFTLDNPNLAFLAALPDQRRIEITASITWTHRYAPVESISESAVEMQQPAWDNNTFGYDTIQHPVKHRIPVLHLENSRSFLDRPGEWYLDTTEGVLYYLPLPGQDPTKARVELPQLETLLEVGGTYDEPVRNLRFEGLTFTGTSWLHPSTSDGYANQQTGTFLAGVQPTRPDDALTSCGMGCPGIEGTRNRWHQAVASVQVSAATNIGIVDSVFTNLGSVSLGIGNDANAHGSGVGLGAQRVTVEGNTFTANAGGGIVVGGVQPDAHHPSDPSMINSDIVISNNRIYETAIDYPDQDAILASYVTRLTIAHNYVSDMPYSGIGIGFGWGTNDPGGSPDYLNRGLYDHQPVYDTPTTLREVTVVANHVRNVVQRMFDAGCIYFLSAMPDSIVKENYCENSGQLGLYFDEGSRYITATGNVFRDTVGEWAHANNMNGNLTGDLTLTDNFATNPEFTFLVDGERRNVVVANNVAFSDDDIPSKARRVMDQAGPTGKYRDPVDAV